MPPSYRVTIESGKNVLFRRSMNLCSQEKHDTKAPTVKQLSASGKKSGNAPFVHGVKTIFTT